MTTTAEIRDGRRDTGMRWVAFASAMLISGGLLNIVTGASALHDAQNFRLAVLWDNLSFWGWAFIVWGVLELASGLLVYSGRRLGSYLGMSLAVIAQAMWFFFLFAAPFAAIAGIAINLLILYGVTVGAGDTGIFEQGQGRRGQGP